MRADLHFIYETKAMGKLFHEPSMKKNAQDVGQGLLDKVKNFVHIDSEHPIESVVSFLTPGLLWMLGFRWLTVLYTVAEALGFDWNHFWDSIGDKIRAILQDTDKTNKSVDGAKVQAAVQSSMNESMRDEIKPEKILALQTQQMQSSSMNNLLFIKKMAYRFSREETTTLEKLLRAGLGNRMRRGVSGFFIRVISWLITAVLIAAGFKLVGQVASHLLGTDKKEDTKEQTGAQPAQMPSDTAKVKLSLNPELDPKLNEEHPNDFGHVWILNMKLDNLKSTLIQWAKMIYPQLTDDNAFENSSQFMNTIEMFHNRNPKQEINIIAVPRPFTSVKDIIDSFAADVAMHMT